MKRIKNSKHARRKESAQDKKSIANIKNVITEIEEQQQNDNDQWPKPPTPLPFTDDWFEQMKRRPNMIHSHLEEQGDHPAIPTNEQL